ncbi:HD domain-containing protein [Fredinandcohnia humi]
MIYVFTNPTSIHEPFYQTNIHPYPWEYELLQTRTLRRLKFLSHYGVGSLVTAAKHSRFEHTIGVWTIIATLFSKDEELRIAALLHDIGHLPFSHAVERTLGFNHHKLTEERIRGEEISSILLKYGFSPEKIIQLLGIDTPLSHKTNYLSADHLDSFLRDAYMLGKLRVHPSEVLKNISFSHHYVQTDIDTGRRIMEAIHADHLSFLAPINLALDALLAKAISIFAEASNEEVSSIQSLTNNELLQVLINSSHPQVNEIMEVILWYPEKLCFYEEEVEGATKVEVKKIYDKSPLVDGTPLVSICAESNERLAKVRSLKKAHYFTY